MIRKFVKLKNSQKILFTPGPASLLSENISSIQPCFGRGDPTYEKLENIVLDKIKKISGHSKIARMQGSASLALEVMINNFLYGKVLVIKTGVYSDRLYNMCKVGKKLFKKIKTINYISYKSISDISTKYDWIIGCPVETSIGYRIPIDELNLLKKKCKSKLALDATASVGLEQGHEYSDVAAFSSCKGLLGLTGASFIVFNNSAQNEIPQFNLDINSHLQKKMTGPYHAICSLHDVLKKYHDFKYAVIANKKYCLKKMNSNLVYDLKNQPYLCTLLNKKVFKKNKKVILYKSRGDIDGSIICHLGEVHLGKKSKGKILDSISF
jgi:aspartate aminotransferase-like enzyme